MHLPPSRRALTETAARTALSTSEEPGLGYATFHAEDKAGCITTCFGPDSAYFSIVI